MSSKEEMNSKDGHDPSVLQEPHLREDTAFRADPSEERAARIIGQEAGCQRDTSRMEHSVWDEPGISPALVGQAGDRESPYACWLLHGRQQTSGLRSWTLTFLCALAAGPFGVVGIFFGGGRTLFSVMAIVIFGPVAEEMMKVAMPLFVVEKRPYLFQNRAQIVICGLCSGLAFAAIENLLYVYVYIEEPSPMLVQWRWTVCVLLHTGCTMVNSLGLLRIWKDVWARLGRPRLGLGFSYAVTAAVIHGVYNGVALLLSFGQYRF